MKPDLILTQIKHTDYPVFRLFLDRYREFFGRVIIYFSEHNRFPYFDHFIQKSLSKFDCVFLDPVLTDWATEDWRNKSTNEMLKYSKSDWIASVEQDFFCKDWNRLLLNTQEAMKTHDLIGWWNSTNSPYIHPSFWFIKREILEKTSKDFSPFPKINGCDHFGMITLDVQRLGGKIKTIQEMGFVDFDDFLHLGGVNMNYLEGLKPEYVFHRPDWFYIYNYWCRKADIPQSPLFTKISLEVEERLKKMFPDINPETDQRAIFFK